MRLKWNGSYGPAAVIGLGGVVATIVSVGIAWGALNGKVDAAALRAAEAKTAAEELVKAALWRDKRIAEQAERTSKIETAVQFIVPAIQRIEAKLDSGK